MHAARRVARAVVATGALLITALVPSAAGAASTPSPSPSASALPGATASPAPDLISFGISPAGLDRPDERPFLQYTVAPGSVIYDHVALLNQDDVPINLSVYSQDVVMAESGLSVLPRADTGKDEGTWITVEAPAAGIDVAAQNAQTGIGYSVVPFRVTVPANAEPGDHVGAIVASVLSAGAAGSNTPAIQLEQRVAARVYVRVDGKLTPGLQVVDVKATWEPGSWIGPGSVKVSYTLRNTGNIRMAVQANTSVAGPFGWLPSSAKGQHVDELLPGGQVRQSVTVKDVWPLIHEDVTVTAKASKAPAGDEPGLAPVSASTFVWAIPWELLAALAVIILVLSWLNWRRRRRLKAKRLAAAASAADAKADKAAKDDKAPKDNTGAKDAAVSAGSAKTDGPPVGTDDDESSIEPKSDAASASTGSAGAAPHAGSSNADSSGPDDPPQRRRDRRS